MTRTIMLGLINESIMQLLKGKYIAVKIIFYLIKIIWIGMVSSSLKIKR